jgi:uncharacterized protein DUF6011
MTGKTNPPPTDRMWNYMQGLAGEKEFPALGTTVDDRLRNLDWFRAEGSLSKWRAMELIDELKAAPLDLANSPIQLGVYRHNGDVYAVQLTRDQTRLYAKRLVEIGGVRLTEAGERVNVDFKYEPGAIGKLRPEERLSWEDARPLVIRYGVCLFGHPLRDATSVELGIGPVCRSRFPDFVKAKPVEANPETSAALARLTASLGRS